MSEQGQRDAANILIENGYVLRDDGIYEKVRQLPEYNIPIDEWAISYDKLQRQHKELRSLLERAKVFALYLGDNKSWNVVSDAAEWLSDYEKLMGKKG